jgi:prophage maintenance system killer protein
VIMLDPADLVTIAVRALGISTGDALAQMDIAAAQDALAEARLAGARLAGHERSAQFRDRAAAAAAGVTLMRALLCHRPFPGHSQRVAVAAGLQFLSLNGWLADLNPAATAVVVVEALASASGVAVITPAAGIDMTSLEFRSAVRACQSAAPGAAVRIVRDAPG